MSCQDRTEF
ncbi:hypothetical protein C6Y45_07465 [Alkalicoccus saliphilus]|uniref:Uncharacterized protein n=1 Tax=Alkalicoccus saliphilus TaxID=200989 RepID=A0A2T4U764_9BACI|nr:hypothetical protein C6Y45_07465 [Alkalicoccus saliphilus]